MALEGEMRSGLLENIREQLCSLGIDHFAIFALAQNEVTMKYVFGGEKAWSSSALLLISTS